MREWIVLAEDSTAIGAGGFRVEFVDQLSEAERDNIQDVLHEITGVLGQHGFPRLANGNVRVLRMNHTGAVRVVASYEHSNDTLTLMRSDYRDANEIAFSVAHELGHRFHDLCREDPRAIGEIDHVLFAKYRECMEANRMPDQNTDGYSRTNHFEFWAVCFQQLLFGELRDDLVDWAEDVLRTFYPRMR